MFALQADGNNIKSISLETSLWTFAKVFTTENFFIVAETPISQEKISKTDEMKMAEALVTDIVQQFTNLFSEKDFTTMPYDVSIFKEIKEWVSARVKIFYEIMDRHEKSDPVWLSQFEHSEKLFTTILNNDPIFIVYENLKKIQKNPNIKKFLTSVELLGTKQILDLIILEEFDKSKNFEKKLNSNSVYLIDKSFLNLVTNPAFSIVDVESNKVLKGPNSNILAQKMVTFLKNTKEKNKSRILEQLRPIIEDEQDFSISQGETSQILEQTIFPCKLCNTSIFLQIANAGSYFSKSAHKPFMGMKLTTYLVAHVLNNEMHYNSVLLDEKGGFFGYIEAYSIAMNKDQKIPSYLNNDIQIIQNQEAPLNSHKIIDLSLIINTKEPWVFEIIKPANLNLVEFIKILLEKLQEITKIYSQDMDYFSTTIGDRKFNIWKNKESIIHCVCFKNEEFLPLYDLIAKDLMKHPIRPGELVILRKRINLVLKFMDNQNFSKVYVGFFLRILFDDLIFSTIQIKYISHISRVIDRVKKEYSIDEESIESLITGKATIFDLLQKKDIEEANQLINVIDFLDLRNLLI